MKYEVIKNIPCDDPRSNEQLITDYRNGDNSAKNVLILKNLKLVIKVAKQFNYYQFELSDLVNQGIIGICLAIDKYSPNKGTKFSTYATGWIYNKISAYVKNNSRSVRYPTGFISKALKINKYNQDFFKKYNSYPSAQHLCNKFKIKQSKLEMMNNLFNVESSLDNLDYNFEYKFVYNPLLPDNKNKIELLHKAIESLPNSQQNFVKWKYGLGCKKLFLKDIAKRSNLTLYQATKLNKEINSYLKEYISQHE